jgi:lysine 2,3-aminomutase
VIHQSPIPVPDDPAAKGHASAAGKRIGRIITAPHQLPASLCPDPQVLDPVTQAFPMRIHPYFLALIQRPDDALARQVIPDPAELDDPCRQADPLAEEEQSPAPLIIHRYPRRVILLVSNQCAIYCRFCMRKRRVGIQNPVEPKALDQALDYIRRCREINEVVLSGGDPLMLGDDALIQTLAALKGIAHVRVLRLHTRIPCAWPARVTADLVQRLSAFHPLYINIHFNHPDEITPQAAGACARLADAGMALGSQTVLLQGVNDRLEVLRELFESLLGIRVRPYYLHQIDRVRGTAHFQVPLARSLELVAGLRGWISGMAMPHFMIDLPGGGGKIELLADTIVEKTTDYWLMRNFQGRIFKYPLSA